MVDVGWDEVVARRLERSSLSRRAGSDRLVEVAAAVCGAHAQVQASAELQLAARLEGVAQADVRAALWERRALVKAWTIRGTLHLHPANELALWHAARRAVLRSADRGLPAWRDPAGVQHEPLAAADVEAVRAAVWEVLDGRCLLRDELVEEVVKRLGAAPRKRLASGFAFFLGELCQGPPRGSRITLARPDQWIEGWREFPDDDDEALREVCRRFLRAYGPARPADFSEWFASSTFKVADARALFAELGAGLEEVAVDGRPSFVLAGDRSFPSPGDRVRLLPEYDAYVMGSRERDRLVPDHVRELIASHGRGRYEGPAGVRLVLVDGIAAGLWERRKRGKRLELTVRLTQRAGRKRQAELHREAVRLGAFLGLEPVLSVDSSV
ncbi:MAG TPA: winged helix DNA-binding domain-containing protein [Gaiellaceae bacterium]|nr:winged helix DNA-binding domain-containing protein [Gaiellaceae bacterium]